MKSSDLIKRLYPQFGKIYGIDTEKENHIVSPPEKDIKNIGIVSPPEKDIKISALEKEIENLKLAMLPKPKKPPLPKTPPPPATKERFSHESKINNLKKRMNTKPIKRVEAYIGSVEQKIKECDNDETKLLKEQTKLKQGLKLVKDSILMLRDEQISKVEKVEDVEVDVEDVAVGVEEDIN